MKEAMTKHWIGFLARYDVWHVECGVGMTDICHLSAENGDVMVGIPDLTARSVILFPEMACLVAVDADLGGDSLS
jgi:hypothetical protein